MSNLVAGLSTVSTGWTRQHPRRLSADLSNRSPEARQRVHDADLNSLILNGNGALRRIEESQASEEYSSSTPAPPYQPRQSLSPYAYDGSVYDYDGESCISPLSSRSPSQRTMGTRGNRNSRYSTYSYRPGDDVAGVELPPPPPAVISRDVHSVSDLGELTPDLRPHTPIFSPNDEPDRKSMEKKKETDEIRSQSDFESELEDEDIKSRVFSYFTDSSDTVVDLRFSLNSTDGNNLGRSISRKLSRKIKRNSSQKNPFGDHAVPEEQRSIREKEEKSGGDDEEATEYISGFKLIVLVLALSSAVFIVAMVSCDTESLPPFPYMKTDNQPGCQYHRNCHSRDYGSIQRARRSRLVWLSIVNIHMSLSIPYLANRTQFINDVLVPNSIWPYLYFLPSQMGVFGCCGYL